MVIPASGTCVVGVRDILSDWSQKAPKLSIRRLDRVSAEPWSLATVRAWALQDLPGYIAFWSRFPDVWFGGIKPNGFAPPLARPGGWGFVGGLNFSLAPDEAMLVTRHHGNARYTGFQINDPWMIAPDARKLQVCLNNTQTVWNADGTATYVICPTDPGVANWLDTEGMRDGIGIMRWQQIPPDLKPDGLIRELRVAKLSEVAAMADLPRVTPEQRHAQVGARWAAYSSRTL